MAVFGGVRIHYRQLGAGPGMVLLHGFPQMGHENYRAGATLDFVRDRANRQIACAVSD